MKPPAIRPNFRAGVGRADKEPGHALKLNEKPVRDDFAGLLDVEIRCLGKIAFGARVNRVGHPSRARRRSII